MSERTENAMNIYDISKKAGVSIATVSRVLNDSAKVSAATRQRVLDVIKETNYMPNAFARSLGLNSMYTVGLLCSDPSDVYQAQAVCYLERELRNHSYTSMLCCTGGRIEEKQNYLHLLLSRSVDALVFIGSHFIEQSNDQNSYIREAAKKVPVFILNGSLEAPNVYSVLCDDRKASFSITELVLSRGARSPVFLYRALSYSGRKKLCGFQDACQEHGIFVDERHLIPAPGDIPGTCLALEKLRDTGIIFDAVVAADDELAVGAVKYAQKKNLSIPEQLQITGYNHSVLSLCSTPELTTVDNRIEYMCTAAVSLLMQVFEGKEIPSMTMYSGFIVEGGTSRPGK